MKITTGEVPTLPIAATTIIAITLIPVTLAITITVATETMETSIMAITVITVIMVITEATVPMVIVRGGRIPEAETPAMGIMATAATPVTMAIHTIAEISEVM
jgi:hypothetical protein